MRQVHFAHSRPGSARVKNVFGLFWLAVVRAHLSDRAQTSEAGLARKNGPPVVPAGHTHRRAQVRSCYSAHWAGSAGEAVFVIGHGPRRRTARGFPAWYPSPAERGRGTETGLGLGSSSFMNHFKYTKPLQGSSTKSLTTTLATNHQLPVTLNRTRSDCHPTRIIGTVSRV